MRARVKILIDMQTPFINTFHRNINTDRKLLEFIYGTLPVFVEPNTSWWSHSSWQVKNNCSNIGIFYFFFIFHKSHLQDSFRSHRFRLDLVKIVSHLLTKKNQNQNSTFTPSEQNKKNEEITRNVADSRKPIETKID